jgi:hypothetical protein
VIPGVHRGASALAATLLFVACSGGSPGGATPSPLPPPGDPTLPDPQYRASYLSPFPAGCDGRQVGDVYTNAEVEPMVAVDPTNPDRLIGVWQQDRWSNGGARGNLTGVSVDGGRTWTERAAPFTRCTGGDLPRASDPWVTISPNGVAYQIAIAFEGQVFEAGSANAVLVSRSADGGDTWSPAVTLILDGASFFNDKESITADPTDSSHVYAVWDRLGASSGGPTLFSRTTDGGATWEPARSIYDPGTTSQTINNQIVVLPDGTLVDFFTQLDSAPGRQTLQVIRSGDKGLTWSGPIVVSPVQALGTQDPETGNPVRDAAILGAITAGPDGSLVAVWQDSRFSGGLRDGIALSRSTDGGFTWAIAARVNRDPTVQAFVPSVAVRTDGTIGVTYYDFRSNTGDRATLPTDYWLARSTDGGATWRESRVAGPFDLAIAPYAGGLFLGDYQSLVGIGNAFVPFYAAVNSGDLSNRTDVFASLVTSAGAAASVALAELLDREAPMPASTAEPLPMTPELRLRLHQAARRVTEGRLPFTSPSAAP